LIVAGVALLAGTGLGVVLGGRSSSPTPAQGQSKSTQEAASSAPAPTRASAATPVLAPMIAAETTGTIASPRPAPVPALAPAPQAPVMVAPPACTNPNAMGVSRVVEIDTSGGPGFGSQHFRSYDFLNDHEVVLTFDDGPWLGHTPAVLKALADQCAMISSTIMKSS
jgi:hypothetical protein